MCHATCVAVNDKPSNLPRLLYKFDLFVLLRTTVAMVFKSLLVAIICATTLQAARVQFWTTRNNCSGLSSEDYQNVPCNTCVDPPFGERVPRSRHFVSNYSLR